MAHWEIFLSISKWLSIPLVIRLYISIQSLHVYGIYQLYSLRETLKNHRIFLLLDSLYNNQDLFNRVSDPVRKELFTDIFKIEVLELAEILLSFRSLLYKEDKNVFNFVLKNKNLDNEILLNLFNRLYRNYRDKVGKRIRAKLKLHGLEEETISYIVFKFYEFTSKSAFRVSLKLENLKKRKNVFFAVLDIFDELHSEVEINLKFLPIEFNSLNGKLNGIVYKNKKSEVF